MGLFDSLKKKELKKKPKIKPSAIKGEVKGDKAVPPKTEVEVIPVEEDIIARELIKPQVRYLKKITITSYADLERVSSELLEGNVVIVDLTPLEKRPDVLEKVAEQIKGMVSALGGQAAKICKAEIKLILVPEDIKIAK
ncbi:cell division protein SepF [Thermococcus sp.]